MPRTGRPMGRPKLPEGVALTDAERQRRYRNIPKNKERIREYEIKVRAPRKKAARFKEDKIKLEYIKSTDYKSKSFEYYERRMEPFNSLFEAKEGIDKIFEKLYYGNLQAKECIVNYINLVQNHGKAIRRDFLRLFSETEIKDIVEFADTFSTNNKFDKEQEDIEQTDECKSELSKDGINAQQNDHLNSLFVKIPEYSEQYHLNTENSYQNNDQVEETPTNKMEGIKIIHVIAGETLTNNIKVKDEFDDIVIKYIHEEIEYKSDIVGKFHDDQNGTIAYKINDVSNNYSSDQYKEVDKGSEDQLHKTDANEEQMELDKIHKIQNIPKIICKIPDNKKKAIKEPAKNLKRIPRINSKKKEKLVPKMKCIQCFVRLYKKSKCINCKKCKAPIHVKCARTKSKENFICNSCSNDKCTQCKKEFRKTSKVISCNNCQNKTHTHCAKSDARVQSFLCEECFSEPKEEIENNQISFNFIEKDNNVENNGKEDQNNVKSCEDTKNDKLWLILDELGMLDFYSIFVAEKVDYEILKEMTHENLQMIGIKTFGDRHRIMKKLQQ